MSKVRVSLGWRAAGETVLMLLAWFALMAFLMVTGTYGCASSPKRTPEVIKVKAKEPDLSGVLRLAGRFSWGHACPTHGGTQAYTSAHVVDPVPFDDDVPLVSMHWEAAGQEGTCYPLRVDKHRDLAVILPSVGQVFPVAFEPGPRPRVGDKVYILGYDWGSTKKAFGDKEIEAEVLRTVAGHLIYSKDSLPGSSGGCVLDARGRLVGIVEGSVKPDVGARAGIAVGLWQGMDSMVPRSAEIPLAAPEVP